ncbi:hypothetical protein TVAG_362600 [Trichomonas vaginalis G3]|uniref:receptor protein-tyrosine kinase n=1 Tax=Trichomonas vaginalis (strain ATCC PRA-98 / G3) TaxID=412133 RepID=A2E638_TRIV3|nr:glycine-rich protein family [Trichomonas vaginalis G3]EAY11880.1 hypothetical protein TVAG_362600 [Trichomonas vaginalis G3]KAI5532291.1 glycine-rich protein family [Trichomonas vaginalis G3]|eukprot:XP_001324103.1 hypothetical protein [Trichomonas vaginalis G3]
MADLAVILPVFFFANQTSTLYLHIGATANTSTYFGPTYNGGAKRLTINDGCGCGATDFRTKSGGWDSNFELRILIAGGGGGAYSNEDSYHSRGGRGGGLNGETDASGKAPYGTPNGCGGTIREKCGEFGKGTGNIYGGGGGGKYGGGTTNNGNNGGGGGSGSVEGVGELGKYKKITDFSKHTGNGAARITGILLIDSPSVCVCNCMLFAQYLHLLFSIVVS